MTNVTATLLLLLLAITAASSTELPEQDVEAEQEVSNNQKGVTLSGLCKMECNKLGCSGFEIPADSYECTCVACEEPGEGRDSVKITFVEGSKAGKAVGKEQLEWTRVQLDTSNVSAKNTTCNNECGHLGCSHYIAKSDEDKCVCSGCNLGEVEEDSRSGREGGVIRGKRLTIYPAPVPIPRYHCYYIMQSNCIYYRRRQSCNSWWRCTPRPCTKVYYRKLVCPFPTFTTWVPTVITPSPRPRPCPDPIPNFSRLPRLTLRLDVSLRLDLCPDYLG